MCKSKSIYISELFSLKSLKLGAMQLCKQQKQTNKTPKPQTKHWDTSEEPQRIYIYATQLIFQVKPSHKHYPNLIEISIGGISQNNQGALEGS